MEKNDGTQKGDDSSGGFSGIKKGLKRILFKPEYLAQTESAQEEKAKTATSTPKQTQSKPSPTSAFTQSAPAAKAVDASAIAKKMFDYVASLNKEGIDFFELWNALEEGGEITLPAVKSTFKILRVGSGNKLTVQNILDTGSYYKTELEKMVNQGLAQKENDKGNLLQERDSEKSRLEEEVTSLEQEIAKKQNELKEKRASLSQIDDKYAGQVQELEQKIHVGNDELAHVLGTMQGILDLVQKIDN
jgi:hypothetical protein